MGSHIAGWRIEIIATDLSNEVLEKAKAGVYSQFEVQRGLPIQLLIKYFTKCGELWQLSPDIRAMVQFRPLNLLCDFSKNGIFDLVVCRNVLIYFDQETKSDVIDRLARHGAGRPPDPRRRRNHHRVEPRLQGNRRAARALCSGRSFDQYRRPRCDQAFGRGRVIRAAPLTPSPARQ